MFIRIVQICSPATACKGQPLLTFWSHTEQSWICSILCPDSCSFKDIYCFASLLPVINLNGIVAYGMRNVNVHLVNFFVRFTCTFMSIAQFGAVTVQSFIWAHG